MVRIFFQYLFHIHLPVYRIVYYVINACTMTQKLPYSDLVFVRDVIIGRIRNITFVFPRNIIGDIVADIKLTFLMEQHDCSSGKCFCCTLGAEMKIIGKTFIHTRMSIFCHIIMQHIRSHGPGEVREPPGIAAVFFRYKPVKLIPGVTGNILHIGFMIIRT